MRTPTNLWGYMIYFDIHADILGLIIEPIISGEPSTVLALQVDSKVIRRYPKRSSKVARWEFLDTVFFSGKIESY